MILATSLIFINKVQPVTGIDTWSEEYSGFFSQVELFLFIVQVLGLEMVVSEKSNLTKFFYQTKEMSLLLSIVKSSIGVKN
jgi:hypothetical protein